MIFSALPVNVGDSFLLRTKEKVVLFDGGMNRSHILSLLRKEKIPNNHIDLLICSHYDWDHINGIIGILKSQRYTFKEIWLPEILGSIGYTLSKKIDEIFGDLRNNYFEREDFQELRFPQREIEDIENCNNSFENIDNGVLNSFVENHMIWDENLFSFNGYCPPALSYKMFYNLKAVSSLISNSLNSGAYIRWFKYQDRETHISYGFGMYSENALQADITLYDNKLFLSSLLEVTLSRINKHSLVFMHKEDNTPDILYTADSDLGFYQNEVCLSDNSIVTAPHHGSSTNDSAYNKICGNDLVYIRSDRSQLKRPGKGYLKNHNRYCTVCRNTTKKQKVEMTLSGASFRTISRECKC